MSNIFYILYLLKDNSVFWFPPKVNLPKQELAFNKFQYWNHSTILFCWQTQLCLFECVSFGFIVWSSVSHCRHQIQTSLFTTCCHVFLFCNELSACSSALALETHISFFFSTEWSVLPNLIKAFVIFKSSITKSTIILAFGIEGQVEGCEYDVRRGVAAPRTHCAASMAHFGGQAQE